MKQLLVATTILAAAAALPLSGAGAAGDSPMKKQNPAATETKGGATQGDAQTFSKSEYGQLDGRTVKNQSGQKIGEIENIVASVEDQTPYAVIAVGGTLGIGEKKVVVTVDELKKDPQDDKVVLMSDKTEAELEKMPAYDESKYKPLDPRSGAGFKGGGNGAGGTGGSGSGSGGSGGSGG